jgi:hypothetical protein
MAEPGEMSDGLAVTEPKVTDVAGQRAAGLAGLVAARREWLERVRAGTLTPAEATAALRAVYGTWLAALTLKALGSGWDMAWHFRWLRDDLAPPHDVNLVGDALVVLLVLFHWYTSFGVDRRAARLMQSGIVIFLLAAPVDVINHRLNGLDITAWSPTHGLLYLGTAIMIAGVIRGWRGHGVDLPAPLYLGTLGGLWFFFLENVLFPSQHQEYGVLSLAAWERGTPYAERSLLEFAAAQIGHPLDRASVLNFALPVPSWVYPVWISTAAMAVLLVARRSVGLRWTATAIAAAYVAWRCLLWPLLVAGGFPPSAVPFLLLAGAIAIDLVAQARQPWPVEAVAGAIVVPAAVYLGGYLQSSVLAAPPIAYWSMPLAALALGLLWAGLRARGDIFQDSGPSRAGG